MPSSLGHSPHALASSLLPFGYILTLDRTFVTVFAIGMAGTYKLSHDHSADNIRIRIDFGKEFTEITQSISMLGVSLHATQPPAPLSIFAGRPSPRDEQYFGN